jgi:RHS repeat-associated protein
MQDECHIFEELSSRTESGNLSMFSESFSSKYVTFIFNTNASEQEKYKTFYPFTFTGKERDEETGYGYFGARYMDHELMTMWLSVDRYADKYPSISPYVYCAWNPIRLTDPTGDTIFNAHKKYRDISADVLRLSKEREQASGLSNLFKRLSIDNKIGRLQKNNLKYQKVQGALDAFKTANPEEYNRLDNLEYNGRSVNIYVSASDKMRSTNGAVGTTHPRFLIDRNTGDVVSISRINICLYKLAFDSGNNGLSTLANELGDAIFAVTLPKNQIQGYYDIKNYKQGYWGEASSNFSRDYEYYIMKPGDSNLPDPYMYIKQNK